MTQITPTPSLDTAVAIAREVRDAGGRALIVGGWVRDRLMGRGSKDIDLEVYGVPADRLQAVLAPFGRVNTVGESFTVYKVAGLDVSLPRRESRVGGSGEGPRDHRPPGASRRRSAHVPGGQPARAACRPVRGTFRARARFRDRRDLPAHPARRPAGRAHLGGDREAA